MDKYTGNYNLPNRWKKKIQSLYRPTSIKEIIPGVNNHPSKGNACPEAFTDEFYQFVKKLTIASYTNFSNSGG